MIFAPLPMAWTVASWPAFRSRITVAISSSSLKLAAVAFGDEELAERSSPGSPRLTRAKPRTKSANARAASAARSSTARSTPNWYIATMRCDQSTSSCPMSRGAPRRSAMTATGMGAGELGDELGRAIAANSSIRSCASAAICGASFSMRRETKARLTRLLSRVCSGGSSSRIEWRSSASTAQDAALARASPIPRDSSRAESAGQSGDRAEARIRRHGRRSTRSRNPPRRTPALLCGSRRRRGRDP